MNNYNKNNFYDDIARGQNEQYTSLKKFGIANVGTSDSSIWNGDTPVYVYPSSAITLTLTSTEAADMQDIHIYGLDANWKMQDEVITLNGTTGVDTSYEYLRVFRMKVIDGGDLTGDVSAKNSTVTYAFIDKEANQTQMAIYSVPLGYNFYIHSLDMGVLSKNAFMSLRVADYNDTDNPATRIVSNTNLYRMPYQKRYDIPMKINGKSDVEGRGYVDSDTDDATYEFEGYLEQVYSVPVDISNYSVTAGDAKITISWDAQTPAETSDLKHFEVRLYRDNDLIQTELLEDKDVAGLVFTNLTNDVEYTVEANWVGYDNKKGVTVTGDATPIVPVPVTGYTLANAFTPMIGPTDGVYFITENSGTSWSNETVDIEGYEVDTVAVVEDFSALSLNDQGEGGDNILMTSTDGSTWTEETGFNPSLLMKVGDKIVKGNASGLQSSDDNTTWDTITGITSASGSSCKVSDYYIIEGSTIFDSSDCVAFTEMTNQPSVTENNFFNLAGSDTTMLLVTGDAETVTKPVYEFTTGDVAWTLGGTSTISGTSLNSASIIYFGGLFHSAIFESDFSAGYYETSPDGTTWTDVSSKIPSGNAILAFATDGNTLYASLANLSDFNGRIMTSSDGVNWNTPYDVGVGTQLTTSMSGMNN